MSLLDLTAQCFARVTDLCRVATTMIDIWKAPDVLEFMMASAGLIHSVWHHSMNHIPMKCLTSLAMSVVSCRRFD